MVYLLLPGPGSHHYHFQHLSGQQRTSQTRSDFSSRFSGVLFILTLHLDEELCLDSARCFALVLAPGATEGVDLIDENDGWLVFPG